MKIMSNEGNQIPQGTGYTILYCVFVRTFVIPFNYCSGSGSDFLTSYGSASGSTRQKVTIPTVPVPVPVPQHW
jgi:hypothetical protein